MVNSKNGIITVEDLLSRVGVVENIPHDDATEAPDMFINASEDENGKKYLLLGANIIEINPSDDDSSHMDLTQDAIEIHNKKKILLYNQGTDGELKLLSNNVLSIKCLDTDYKDSAYITMDKDGYLGFGSKRMISFSGYVNFEQATVNGLPSSGLDIPSSVINYNSEEGSLFLNSNGIHLYAMESENSEIEIVVGENDDTYIGITPKGLGVSANNGKISFNASEEIAFTAKENANITFNGNVDFSNANVIGLPTSGGGGNGGTLAIEVEELPTENIDDSKIYVLNGIKNAQLYYFGGINYHTLEDMVLGSGINSTINYYVVNELPTNGEITDLQTLSVINCYIFNDVAYVYGNAGDGNTWITVSALFAQIGNPTENKGRVYDLTNTSVEVGLYVYYEEFRKFYLYSNSEWKEIDGKITENDKYILRLSGDSGVLSDEEYQKLVDNLENTTIIVTNDTGTIVLNTIATMEGIYLSTFSMGSSITMLYIASNKAWAVITDDLSEDFIHRTGSNDIWANNTFNTTNTFSETSSVEFKGKVDFTNANVTGLSGGGLTQEQIQEMINTAINGALEGSY